MYLRTLLVACVTAFFSLTALADKPLVELDTSVGKITLQLEAEKAPITVDNFLQYVDEGFYNNTIFHRVIEGFMLQGGGFDPELKRKPTREPIQNEATNGLKNYRYSIAMARTQSPHSATAQFFINTQDNTFLDHKAPGGNEWGYAVFGKVIDGLDTIEKISAAATGARAPFRRDVPLENIIIKKASRITLKSSP